jgi:hypothetical protein
VVAVAPPPLPHHPRWPQTRGDQARPLSGPWTVLHILLRAQEGDLRSSSCLRTHRSRNHYVLRRPLPQLPPTPTTVANARVRARGRGKSRTMAPATTVGAPRCGPPNKIPGLAPSRCGQGCVLHSSSWRVHCSTPYIGSFSLSCIGVHLAPTSRPPWCRRPVQIIS